MFAFLLTVVILFSLHSKRDVDCERRKRPRRELLRGLSSPTWKKEFVSLYGTKKREEDFLLMVGEHIKSYVFDECIIASSKVNQVEISNRPLEEQDKFGEETLTADVNL